MDLTRFDFNVHNFLNSESVESMTDAEVGQYVLLLSKSWALAKDASLPDNPAMLARWAHCDIVSPNVLKKFPQVETADGVRRRNGVLFTEWQRATARSDKKRRAAEARWDAVAYPIADAVASPMHMQAEMPKPNQASIPNQTEPESETMSMKNRINQSAGSKIVDQRNSAEFELLAWKYGKEVVIADFEAWYGTTDGLLQWPGSAYLKIANSRLQSGAQSAIIQSDSRINEIIAFVYTVSQQAPRSADVAKMLAENSQEDIQEAFKEYADGLDDFGLKNSVRAFFKDGAGTGIILARRQKKAADAKLAVSIAMSIDTGVEARRAEADARKKKIDDEEKLADKLGDSPF